MACNGVRKPRKTMTKLEIKELGLVNFEETYQAMLNLIATKPNFHSIWLLEHNPVFTIGISEKNIRESNTESHVLIDSGKSFTIFLFVDSLLKRNH